ncbi:MAG: succinyldiaminopimelate transaminase [Gammaproteobacteria bacterium]|jgi:N-succinyldiaminopimelate aminotransferase
MNPDLFKLQAYPFEKLTALKAGITPPADKPPITLSVGEPQHSAPAIVTEELIAHLHGLSRYPATKGSDGLREAIGQWLVRRFALSARLIDPGRHILPVNGTREALFSFAQAVIDRHTQPLVIMPNPFYQIYEGAALLAGAQPWYLSTLADSGFTPDFSTVPDEVWTRTQLVYICSPGNPSGAVMDIPSLQQLIGLADRHGFIIASDECYSEIYSEDGPAPAGLLAAAAAMGRDNFKSCVAFHSLSKRSNVPGLRSGFVAGDADVLDNFLRYRTYHGCAMSPPIQAASAKAWSDEQHVRENRALYTKKFAAVLDILKPVMDIQAPTAGFYLWPYTHFDDQQFARRLYAEQNVTVLPGVYLSRTDHNGVNPGQMRVRIALVPTVEECIEAAERIREFVRGL